MDIDELMAMPLTAPLTLPDTQNADNIILTQPQDVVSQRIPVVWGMMLPHKANLPNLRLEKDVYLLGRQANCDIIITNKHYPEKMLTVVSKIHLRIIRETENVDSVVYLEDLSSNGTFVNNNLVGKGKRIVLDNNDTISLAKPDLPVYVFKTNMAPIVDDLPRELRSKYVVSRKLGAGAFGEVKLVYTKDTRCKKFAMKTISKKSLTCDSQPFAHNPDKIMNEARILQALQHPFIIAMEEIIDSPTSLYIILELMEGGELYDRIRKNGNGLTEPCAKMIIYQVVQAVAYLHKSGITHRDLKPENILLATNDEYTLVKVSDFGLSKFVNTESMLQTFCGTPMYVAPEVLVTSGRGTYTKQVDVWSLGVILYICLSGLVPFLTTNARVPLQQQIMRGIYKFPQIAFANKTQRSIDLIKRMLTVDPKKRITINEVLLDRWLQDRHMRATVAELTNVSDQNQDENIPSTSLNNNNKHVLGPPTSVAKRQRRA